MNRIQVSQRRVLSRREFLTLSSAGGAALLAGGSGSTWSAEPKPLSAGPTADAHSLIVISGSPRERGRQYGKRFEPQIRQFLDNEIYRRFVTGGNSKERLLKYAGLCQKHVKKLSPTIADEMEGMAEGTGLKLEEIALITLHEELYHKGIVPLIEHCTATAVGPPFTSDGNTYVAQSWDWMQSVYGKSQMLHWKRDDGPSVLNYSFPGLWIGAGLNSAGIALCWTSAQGGGPGIGVPSYVLLAHLLYQPTLEAVVEEARRAKQAGWFTFVMGDGRGNLLNVEGSPEKMAIEPSRGELSRVYFGTHAMTNTPEGKEVPRHPQCLRMMDLVRGKKGRIDRAVLQNFYGDHESTICKHFGTLDVMVFNTTKREAYVTRGPGCRAEWTHSALPKRRVEPRDGLCQTKCRRARNAGVGTVNEHTGECHMPRRLTRLLQFRSTSVALVTLLAALSSADAADAPLHRWQFHQQHADGQSFKPLAGWRPATATGPVRFSEKPPHAFVFDGDAKARQHVAVATDLKEINLPQKAISVSAWVLVETPAEWGGICGVIQDNGDYERGWLLGCRQSRFFFAVSSEGRKRLTYLINPRGFEAGYWYHVVGTYDGKRMALHVDGKLRADSQEQSGNIAYPPQAFFTIGAYHDENEFYPLTGQVERVSVYDRSLTAKEIAAEFTSRKQQFPEIDAVAPRVTGWPTFLRDNQRTGISKEKLTLPLHEAWVHQPRHPPQPAWPAPAKQNFWHKKYNLKPRVIYDRAYHVVASGDAAYFASSADDKVYCLDAASGEERWSFFTEAPVRLAPTIHDGKVLFGSDDGHVYCLNAADGSLAWKYRHDAAEERQIAGNGRVISAMPVRTGVLIDENIGYFCTGLFPSQAVYQVALDVETGKRLASGKINVSAQGYLERRSGKLYVPSGRDPAGAFASGLKRRGKGVGKELSRLPEEYPYAFIGAAGLRFGGGDGKVSAFRADDGKQLWTAAVEGKAYGLSIAGGRLFVSTDAGLIYCFGEKKQASRRIVPPENESYSDPDKQIAARYEAAAKRILDRSSVSRGYALVLGSGEGRLAYELARHSDLKIVCLEEDAAKVAASRLSLDAAGLSGRVAVHHRSPAGKLPYTDYLFNLVVSDSIAGGRKPAGESDEILRVLRPGGGVAFFGFQESEVVRRPPLEGIGEWSHMYSNPANTACSTDTRVRGKMALQWFGRPGPRQMIDRHHRTVAPLWKDGRLFIPGDDRIFAADAYNGTPLWSMEIPNSRRVGAFRDCSYMAAGTGRLYVGVDDKCLALNAETGYTETTFRVPAAKDGKPRDWGYVANVDRLLIGSGVKPGASRRTHSLDTIMEAAYFDFRHAVTSDFVFAFDLTGAKHRWTYHSAQGAIPNATLAAGGGKMFFVESRNAATLKNPKGRTPLLELLGKGADLIALDMKTGKVDWRVDGAFTAAGHNLYCCYADGKLVVVGSRNSGSDKETAEVLFDVFVYDAASGKPVWNATQKQSTKIGGDHGEQDLHPVIVGEKLYCEPFAYELHTGKRIDDWGWTLGKRSGCGTISASASAFFYRQSNPTMFDLTTRRQSPVTTSTRPGCWINIIPAGGLLLIPEASSGCTCDYAVQTSLAFLPVE